MSSADALRFSTKDGATRYGRRHLGIGWHVAEVEDPRLVLDAADEGCALLHVVGGRCLAREDGLALAAHRAVLAARAREVRRAEMQAWRL